jgi:hypothetical protein
MTISWTDDRLGNGSLVVMQGKLSSQNRGRNRN